MTGDKATAQAILWPYRRWAWNENVELEDFCTQELEIMDSLQETSQGLQKLAVLPPWNHLILGRLFHLHRPGSTCDANNNTTRALATLYWLHCSPKKDAHHPVPGSFKTEK
ncbi:hypothetical protein E1B28_002668 [Marasmius oreades]|uniref:Uncharacterized protein n=1 Tax=Marasmius oreades TaxID=181124 RepID=A0A9P7UM59_9AGAR|nr:uncharacterized protein E1B28_002668 [Marasmius oreades]KAG7086735.1 hypothetical protein E1B28_002668 [Marasmius oreades]